MIQRYQLLIRDRHGFERTVPLARSATLGRQSLCDIVLPDSMISRTHLRLELIGDIWWAEDLRTTHGSFYQGKPLGRQAWEPGTPLRLADGAYTLTLLSSLQSQSEIHLQAILETAQLMAQEVDLEDLLEQSMDRLLSISRTDRGFLMLLEDGELNIRVQRNLGDELEGSIQLSLSSVQSVFETGNPIWILNVADDQQLATQQSVMRLELKTILCLPLLLQGRRIGVVYLDSRRPITEPPDRQTFEAIVALCAIAIERTRLSEENLRGQVLATVGQVSSTLVHDFKNGLFVLRGHADLLALSSDDPKVQHHCQKILESADRLTALSQDVLDYAKVREPNREKVEIRTFLDAILEPLEPRAAEMGVSLRTEGESCVIRIDPGRFTRVIENLVTNALDAMVDMTGEVILSWNRSGSSLHLSVRDTGRGIPKKYQKRIFEPFFSYGKKRGTGLGMATVRKIVEEHGGTLEVTSEEGQGTEVRLMLPDLQSGEGSELDESTGKHRALDPGAL